jgi:hypothetical protein
MVCYAIFPPIEHHIFTIEQGGPETVCQFSFKPHIILVEFFVSRTLCVYQRSGGNEKLHKDDMGFE